MKKNQKPMPSAPKEIRELLDTIHSNSQVLAVDTREQLDTLYGAVDDLANALYQHGLIEDSNRWRKAA